MILRAPAADDVPRMYALLDAASRASYGEGESEEEFRLWLDSPHIDVVRDIRVADDAGQLVGYADVDPVGDDPVVWWCDVRTHPDADPAAVLPLLVGWVEDRVGSGTMRVWAPAHDERRADALARLGFARVRTSYRMHIDLRDAAAEPAWPAGVTVREFRDEDAVAVYEAHKEIWRDTWQPLEESFDEWARWNVAREGFDPSLWFLAFAGDELVAMAQCRVSESDPDMGWVSVLGVRDAWRRRGLGEALLRHSFEEFRRRGLMRGGLGVDAASPTGATRLYERVGMRVYRETAFFEKELA